MNTVLVVGEGAWGTAIAILLAYNGHKVYLWCHDSEVKKTIEKTRSNERYFPGVFLDELIIPTTNLNEAIQQSAWIFESTPVKYLRSVLTSADPSLCDKKPWVILSKGIENETLLLPSQIVSSVLKTQVPIAVFSGPSFAHDLAAQHITAVTLATDDELLSQALHAMLANDYFKMVFSSDLLGVQMCGALKNVIALCVGMLSGAGYGDNTKAFVITQGLHEMESIVTACGGQRETVYGLAGVGDVMLTSLGKHSKNLKVGFMLGQGKSLHSILQETGMVPEGVNTVQSVYELLQQKNLKLPFFEGMYSVVFGNELLSNLLLQL